MNEVSADVWEKLEHARPSGGRFAASRFTTDVERLLCAVDEVGGRHLLVLLRDDEEPYRDRDSRGLTVESRDLRVVGEEPKRYLDIECLDPAGFAALDIMASEIADGLRLGGEKTAPHEVVRRVLAKWRRFWGHLPKALLTREEQVGLFAEIWFLSFWLIPRVGPRSAVRRWRGPFGARHDFEWSSASVEVKATTSTRGRVHLVNGLDQLTAPPGGALYLFSLRLREEASATNSLPALIRATKSALAEDEDAIASLEEGLARSGYGAHSEEYEKTRFRVLDEHLYDVREGFPRLPGNCLVSRLPAQIEHVQYMLNLVGVEEYCVARTPSEASIEWWSG